MTTVIHRAEGIADTVAQTTSNTGGPAGTQAATVNGTVTASVTHVAHGQRASKYVNSANSTSTIEDTTALGTLTIVRGREYVWIDGAPPANLRIGQVTQSGTLACGVGISTGQKLRLNDGTSTQMAIGTTNVPTGQWVRIEWRMVASTTVGQASAKIWYSADSTGAADESISSAASFNTRSNFDRYFLGNAFSASQTYTRYGDEGAWSDVDAEIGPYVDPVTVSADFEGGSPLAPFDSTSGTSVSTLYGVDGGSGVLLDSTAAPAYLRVGPTQIGPGRRYSSVRARFQIPDTTLSGNTALLRWRNNDPLSSGGGGNGDIWVNTSDESVRGDLQPADFFISSAGLITAGAWYQLNAVCGFLDDGTSMMKVKVNGVEIGNFTSTLNTVGQAHVHLDLGSAATLDARVIFDDVTVIYSDSVLDYQAALPDLTAARSPLAPVGAVRHAAVW